MKVRAGLRSWHFANDGLRTKRFQFHFTLGRELAQTLDETPLLAGLNPAAYEQWRSENKLVDNLSNRFRYASLVAGAN